MAIKDGNNTERRARLKQRGQEVEMMDDRPITGDERDQISGIHEGTDNPNLPPKALLVAGGIGLAALGVARLLGRGRGRRRKRGSWLVRRILGKRKFRPWPF